MDEEHRRRHVRRARGDGDRRYRSLLSESILEALPTTRTQDKKKRRKWSCERGCCVACQRHLWCLRF